ncbi:nuclear transport factor 2 family protein [Sphingomonadaceae bacterium G21617-S1]|nr:nuclear transport factor 2 family protein [Sphingomonadaceae bacterium G21617-S1]
MDTADKLFAIEEIKALKARYFRFLDTKDWPGLRSVFMPEAVIEVPEAVAEPQPLDQALAFIEAAVDGGVSIHFGHMPEIFIESSDRARGIWAMDDRIYWSTDKAAVLGYAQLRGFGHYHETYERLGGEWKIKTMRLTRLRLITQKPPIVIA